MASPLVRDLIDAGVHFGHRSSRWNPKMKPYIFEKRNLIHILDIKETVRGLLRARKFLARLVADGEDVLFVGTKRQAREAVRTHATRCGMHYVIERWLGGTLTNFRTIRSRLQRLEELESLSAGPRWEAYSKKMQSTLGRELKKIRRNLEGVRKMGRLPGALVIVDVRKESNAVREAKQLGIPTLCLIDTDSDPDFASIPIPGNDDAIRSIELVVSQLADAIEEGRRGRVESTEDAAAGADSAAAGRRRGRRMQAAVTASASGPLDSAGGQAVAALDDAPPVEAPAAEMLVTRGSGDVGDAESSPA